MRRSYSSGAPFLILSYLKLLIFLSSRAIHFSTRFNTLSRRGEGRVWDLGAQRVFSALRLKILMPGAKNRRQAVSSHTPAFFRKLETVDKRQLRARLRACLRLVPLPLSLRERVGERVQGGLLKFPRIQILLRRQCVGGSGSGPETHTPTLSLVRERASRTSSPAIPLLHFSSCNQFFDGLNLTGEGVQTAHPPTASNR
jgi:hypothetical protein